VRCGPPPDLQDELAAATTALFAAVAASLPVEVDLETVLRDSSSAGLAGPIRAVASASSVVDTLIPLVLVVLAAATVVAGLSLRSALRAWAVPLVVSGLLLLALAALAVPLLGGAGETLRRAIADDGGAPELADIGGSMAMAMASQLGAQLVQVAVVLLAGGTLLAAARWVLGRS
jgi:hypothetical protein